MNEFLIVVATSAVIYIFLIAAVTIFGKSEFSQLNVSDLIFILLLSEAVQNGLVSKSWDSVWVAVIAATTLFVMNYILRQVLYKSKKARKLLEGEPVMLIYMGRVNKKNMEKQKITIEELESAVREKGVETIAQVKLAVLETEGEISVISFDK